MKKLLYALALMASVLGYAQHDFRSADGRCATPDYQTRLLMYGPSYSLAGSDCSATSTNPTSAYDANSVYEINVVVHIITNGATGQISDAMVASQIEVLNEDFLAKTGTNGAPGTYTGIRFKLATVDPNGNATNGITRHDNSTWFNDGGSYWNTLNWDPKRYLNIYTNNGGGALGYVPSLPANGNGSIVGTAEDRVVVLWDAFGRNSPKPPYDLGRTTTHEVGHYLGLEHTFNGGCSSASQPGCYTGGDLICDTLPESSPNQGGCTSNPNTCNDPDPIDNYMDYSNDSCMNKFTTEQMRRMRCTLESWRSDLINTAPPGNTAPVANFSHSANELVVTFTDSSTDSDGTVQSWAWNFGDNNTSSAKNPTHTYASAGTFTVTLTVTDDKGATNTKTASITVTGGGSSSNELTNGAAVTGLNANSGDMLMYFIRVPSGASNLSVSISGGTGDADLYLRRGAEPTTSAYDCRPYQNGNSETCTVASPAADTYYVGIRAYSSFSNVSVVASYQTGGGGCPPYTDSESGISVAQGAWKYYTLQVPECANSLSIAISGGTGDADLYVKQGTQPTTSSYDCRPYQYGNTENCNINNPAAGTWHIGIRGYSSSSNVKLDVSYQ